MSQLIAQNAFRVVEGRPVTTSRIVAECFGKQHQHVMRDIRALIAQKPELEQASNFGLLQETVQVGNGGTKHVTIYWMDRKGFSILAMGFTGAKALDFKCAFYDEFERMEKELHPTIECPAKDQLPPPVLTEQQAYTIMSEVAKRAKNCGAHYQTIYRALKARYQVTKYTHIPREKFEDAVRFIQTVNLRVPEATPQKPEEPEEKRYVVTKSFLERQRVFVYYWRYLFRGELEIVIKLMRAMESPHAGMLWDAVHDMNLASLEDSLAQLGFPVTDLNCYKHWLSHQPA